MDHTKYPNSLNTIVTTIYFVGSFTHGLDCYSIAHFMHAILGRWRRRTCSVRTDWKPVSWSKANEIPGQQSGLLLVGDRESRQQTVSAPCRTCSSTRTGRGLC